MGIECEATRRWEAQLLRRRPQHLDGVAVVALRIGALLHGLDKVAPDGGREHVPKRRLPEADATRAHDGAAREHGVHKGKGRGDGALEKGLAEAAQRAVLRVVEPTRHAPARGALVPRRVGAVVRDAVPQPAHRLAEGRRPRVPRAVEPLDARRVPSHRLRVRDARAPRLEPSHDHVAQPRGFVEDHVPVADELLLKKREGGGNCFRGKKWKTGSTRADARGPS